MATYHFLDACESYEKALSLKSDDQNILDAISKAKKANIQDNKGILYLHLHPPHIFKRINLFQLMTKFLG